MQNVVTHISQVRRGDLIQLRDGSVVRYGGDAQRACGVGTYARVVTPDDSRLQSYRVEVSDCFSGTKRWVEVAAESMTYARAAALRLGCYDTHRVEHA